MATVMDGAKLARVTLHKIQRVNRDAIARTGDWDLPAAGEVLRAALTHPAAADKRFARILGEFIAESLEGSVPILERHPRFVLRPRRKKA